ncbi:MAG: hypothetical protein PUP90_14870 [Nostoc sp. S4]|nr:hypothetical protein [Nostoc sp. S4]
MINDKILNNFAEIISQFKANSDNQFDLQKLKNTQENLRDISSELLFELFNARKQKNWEEIDKLELALTDCENILDSVTAAIIDRNIIGIAPENLAEMQKILKEIDAARKTQINIDFALSLLGFLRRLFL